MKSKKTFGTDYFGIHESRYQNLRKIGSEGWGGAEHAHRINRISEIVSGVLKKVSIPSAAKFLDLGCGDGSLAILLGALGYEVNGIDVSPTAIQWAKDKAREQKVSATFTVGSVLKLKYPSGHFDVVIDSACAHCIIGNDRSIYFNEVMNVLRQNGIFILMCLCGDPTEEELVKYFDPQTRCIVKNGVAGRYYGKPEDILNEIQTAGLHVNHWAVINNSTANQNELFLTAIKQIGGGTETP
ncbi:MAG: class I SAM-dependent methyltransferase [Candidatus Riflebacteria bacterium]|nr:class I SAM-dependent methyltransferase [Candidatus Riflebacteria bacterium]